MSVVCVSRTLDGGAVYSNNATHYIAVRHEHEPRPWNIISQQCVVTLATPLNEDGKRIGKTERFYTSSFDRVAAHMFGNVEQLVTHAV